MAAIYCSQCGTKLVPTLINDETRQACPNCSYVDWGNYSISVGAIVIKDHKVLLVERNQMPGKGNWTNPGGYIEQNEILSEGVVREITEELSIKVQPRDIIMIADKPGATHNTYIAFIADYVSGNITIDPKEVIAADFFTLEEMKTMQIPPLTQEIILTALKHKSGLLTSPKDQADVNGFQIYNL